MSEPDEPVLNRELQRELLRQMAAVYPEFLSRIALPDSEYDRIVRNLIYLEEHKLCELFVRRRVSTGEDSKVAKITAKGLDFLADDGGLTAILGTITVKLHADTVRALIEAKIDDSNLPDAEKETFRTQLRKLPSGMLNAAAGDLVQAGLDHLPNAIEWLRLMLGL